MKKILLSLSLCFQLVSTGLAQQMGPPPTPKPTAQKPAPPPQEPDKVDVVKITTNLVQVDAVVTDQRGRHVTDLRPEEVEILENGKPQKISDFGYIKTARSGETTATTTAKSNNTTPVPVPPRRLRREEGQRTIALVVDDLRMSSESVHYMRQALKKFLDEQMQPGDFVAIIRTAGGMGALQQFTSDKEQLYAAVAKLKWVPRLQNSPYVFAPMGMQALPLPVPNGGSGAELDEMRQIQQDMFAVGTLGALRYVVRGLRDLPGRKSIILFSDGLQIFTQTAPEGSSRILDSLDTLLDLANRASVVINTMDVRGLVTFGLMAMDSTRRMSQRAIQARLRQRRENFLDSQQGLDYLAEQTGGLAIRNTNDINGGVQRIMDDQAGYYLIGYRPDDSTFDPVNGRTKFHHLDLKVKRPGNYTVRMRTGFYGVTDESLKPTAESSEQQLISAALSAFGSSDVQVRLTSLFDNDPVQGSVLRSFLHVNASDLTFTKDPDGSHKAVFDLIAVTFGEDGKLVDQFANQHTINLTEAMFQKITKYGFTYNATVPIKKPGAYQFRTALRDVPSTRVGSASQFVQVPDINKERLMTSGLLIKGMPLERYLKGENTAEDSDPMANTSVRQFRTPSALVYALTIYNAKLDKATGKPSLTIQARLFRNGEAVFTGKEVPFAVREGSDPKRLGGGGGIQLGTSMEPGEYVLQIVVTDLLANDRYRVTTQWMDFEIVK